MGVEGLKKDACGPQTPKAVLTLWNLHIESSQDSFLCFDDGVDGVLVKFTLLK